MHSPLKSLVINSLIRSPMSTSSPLSSLPFSSSTTKPATGLPRLRSTTVTATSTAPLPSLSSSNPYPNSGPKPTRPIPGEYGPPIIGPIKDRLDYFYNQGTDEFFRSRVKKYDSTVFRGNMPPGPPISSDPRVIVLLDGKSFPVLFDVSKVEKRDVFTGTYMPSLGLTGGYRILSYLDPSEPNHEKLKRLVFFLLKSTRDRLIPEFHSSYSNLFHTLESEIAAKNHADFTSPAATAAFDFLSRAWYRADPARYDLKDNAPKIIAVWVLFQLAPILHLGLPKFLEEITIRTFRLPAILLKRDYNKLYNFFYENSGPFLDEAVELGLSKEEACHNLLFVTCFNTFGGMSFVFPSIIKHLGGAGEKVHLELAREIRSAVKAANGEVTMAAMEQMPLMKSAVYEALRIDPPVQFQYGRAKKDLVVESHDSVFEVKAGEMLFGYQPFATKDPVIFDRPEEYVVDRFVGEGERLLSHVLWSNGPETGMSTVNNKQCPGKDFVVFVTRLLVVELFLRYDSFEIDAAGGSAAAALGPKITKLVKASF